MQGQQQANASPPQGHQQPTNNQPAPQNAATAGPGGRRFHIAHRRSPSEYTPLMLEQYALQQQIEVLQAQQQALASQLQPQQYMMQPQQYGVPVQQYSQYYPSPPQVQQTDLHRQHSGGHGRNRSMHAPGNMAPPPAPSTGSNTHVFDTFPGQVNPPSATSGPARRGGHSGGGGHARRHSLALTEAKERAAARQQANAAQQTGATTGMSPPSDTAGLRSEYTGSTSSFTSPPTLVPSNVRGGAPTRGHSRSQSAAVPQNRGVSPQRQYQFPPNTSESQQSGLERRGSIGSSHQRSGSRSESNWRQPQDTPQAGLGASQHAPSMSFGGQSNYGHSRGRGSIGGSFSGFPPGMPGALTINPMYAQQAGGLPPILSPQLMQQQQLVQIQLQQQQQQRKSLFAPYLPQGQLPGLLQEGKLVSGFLRVNKKNRSDAYVSTDLLESDIFICGSKDRNRALEGDFVAVELLDVDEVWSQKREKEEKKKRKGDDTGTGGLKRQGSIRIREGGKRKDDVEVEGQGLLLDVDEEEEEGQGDPKPMYAGHVVAVIERVAGQLFSGTLGLLRPSSAATKEKQEQERLARGESNTPQPQYHRQQEKPKIVWFKPTDKRVPLIAIPTEQAPKDFIDNHANYANTLFVAAIKRWPITSLHPFGTLVEELGNMGDVEVESEAILRDNNFTNEKFGENLLASIPDSETVIEQAVSEDGDRRDFRDVTTFTIDPVTARELDDAISLSRSEDGKTAELGVHIADVSYFVRPNSLADREARKRATSVYLVQRAVSMLPEKLSELCSLEPGKDRLSISVVFTISLEDETLGTVNNVWMGRSVIQSKAKLSYDLVQKVIDGEKTEVSAEEAGNMSPKELVDDILFLHRVTSTFRANRFDTGALTISASPLRLMFSLDDEEGASPSITGYNVFESTPAMQLIEELMLKANMAVAERIRGAWGGEGAFLRRHDVPLERRLDGFIRRCQRLGIQMDIGEDGRGLMKNLAGIADNDIRTALETLLVKSMQRAKYFVAGKVPEEQYRHYALNVPLYTHFTSPIRRYADIIVHRQLQSALANESTPPEDAQSLIKLAEHCNFKKDAARTAQEQSVHLFLCRMLRDMTASQGPVVRCGIVVNVQSSSFDVVIPEFGIEKRVHLDQLPLVKAEFDRSNRILELFWEKGVDSMTYNPEEVKGRQRTTTSGSLMGNGKSHWRSDSQAEDDLNLAVSSMGLDDNMALFDSPVPDSPPTKALRVPAIQTNTSIQSSRSAPTSPVRPPADTNTWLPGLPSESGRTASLMNVTIGESNGRPSTGGTDKEPVEELREEEGVQVIRELCRVWVVIRAEVAGEAKSGGSLIFLKAMNPFP